MDLDAVNLNEIDRFLEDGVDALSPAAQRTAKRESPAPPRPGQEPDKPEDVDQQVEEDAPEEAVERPEPGVTLSEDGLQAAVSVVYPDTTEEEILELLQKNKVTVGVLAEAIRKAVETVQETGQPLNAVAAAEGTPPKAAAPPRIQHCPPEGLDALPALEPILKLQDIEDRKEMHKAAVSLQVWAVHPGDRLAVLVVDEGEPGATVQGESIPPPAPEDDSQDTTFQPGPGVELASNGTDYLARIYGYAGIRSGQVSVEPPVWISPDAMVACFLNLPAQPGTAPLSSDELQAALKAAGVSVGIDDKVIAALCKRLEKGGLKQTLVLLARARPPEPPQDAAPAFSFDYELRGNTILPDGTIDFKERSFFPRIEKDALLVECAAPTPGTPGQTVRGDEISVPDPAGVELTPGDNVRLEEQDGTQRLYAEIDGGASVETADVSTQEGALKRYTVAVRAVAQISSDVDYETGNIDFQGNVEVQGSITSGFRVLATGDITVSGTVEADTEVRADGSVTVSQGIVGGETRVTASGTVTAKFIQDARVEAEGDVVIGSYIRNAYVQSGGRVQVEGGSEGGIVGGETWAVGGITSSSVGSEWSAATYLAVGIEPDLYARSERVRQAVQHTDTFLEKLLKALGLETFNSEEVKKLVAQNPARKNTILQYVKKADQLTKVREKHFQQQKALSAEIAEAAGKATLDVPETAYARVKVQIGYEEAVPQDDLKGVRFQIDPTGEKTGIIWTDLSEGK